MVRRGIFALAAGATLIGCALRLPVEAPAAPAYIVAEIAVSDPEGYKGYLAAVTPVVAQHGGRYLARAGRVAPQEGEAPVGRVVVIGFPSFAAAEAFLASPDYKAVAQIRHRTATSRVYLVEGVVP